MTFDPYLQSKSSNDELISVFLKYLLFTVISKNIMHCFYKVIKHIRYKGRDYINDVLRIYSWFDRQGSNFSVR